MDQYRYNARLIIRIYIFNGQLSNFSHFLFLIWIWSNYICIFWYYIHIKTQVNQNFSTSTFLFFWYLDEPWDHAVWYYSIPATIKKKKTTKNALNNNNSCDNNFKYCFNKLYYDCKHLIVLSSVGSAWYNQRQESRVQ